MFGYIPISGTTQNYGHKTTIKEHVLENSQIYAVVTILFISLTLIYGGCEEVNILFNTV